MGLVAVALTFVASNADEYSRWGNFDANGPLVLAPDGCEVDYYANDNKQKIAAETPHQGTRSAARGFSPEGMNLSALARQGQEYMAMERQHFVMAQSGIEVAIHAPEQVEVDEKVFAELFHAPLLLDREYRHPEVRQLVACYRRDILEKQKFAGTVYHVFIAPDSEHCIKHARFQPVSQVEDCDATGFTPPELEVEFAGLNLVNYYMMMLSTARSGEDGNITISETLTHESVHAYMSLMDQPLRLDPDERLAKQIEDVVIAHKYPNGIPIAIRYP